MAYAVAVPVASMKSEMRSVGSSHFKDGPWNCKVYEILCDTASIGKISALKVATVAVLVN